jgi:glyceraldehyde 3-phosphate dehydrogenase
MNLQLGKEISIKALNNFLRQQAFHSDLKEQIGFTNSPEVVSTDFVGDRHAGIIDSAATIVNGDKCVLYVWYDNEYGYTAQLLGLAKEMVGLTYQRYPNFSQTS